MDAWAHELPHGRVNCRVEQAALSSTGVILSEAKDLNAAAYVDLAGPRD